MELVVEGLSKSYPGVKALDDVSVSVGQTEVVGLIGENGAGKSTLIKILGGLTSPDSGTIMVDGKPVVIKSASGATSLGIAVIHQELSNLDNLSVASNIFLGREPRKMGLLIDQKAVNQQARGFLQRVGLEVDPSTLVSELSVAEQQMVEIAKALSQDARLIIMDEPTSSLTAGETETLLGIIGELKQAGVSVVYVSHRLGEVLAIADRVVGLRDGQNAGELTRDTISYDGMVRLMVGRDIEKSERVLKEYSGVRLAVSGLRTVRFPKCEVNFEVRAGEIVGIAGLVGAGRSELVRTLFGIDKRVSGDVMVDGVKVPAHSPRASIAQGMYLAPEDRRSEGVITEMSIRENVTLPSLPVLARLGLVNSKQENALSEASREKLQVKATSVEDAVRNLSGGNQQKVVLSKWLCMSPKVMIFDEPTRGIDIGSRAEIYSIIRDLAAQNIAVLIVSSDLEEILEISDRVIVMGSGAIKGEIDGDEATEENIMQLAVAHV